MKLKIYLASIMLVILAGLIPIAAMAEEKKDAAPAAATAVTTPAAVPATIPAASTADAAKPADAVATAAAAPATPTRRLFPPTQHPAASRLRDRPESA